MYTELAELFLQTSVDIRELKKKYEDLAFNAGYHNLDPPLHWCAFVDDLIVQAADHSASILMNPECIEAHYRSVAHEITQSYPEEVRPHIDTDALADILTNCVHMKLLKYPEPIYGTTEGMWCFV